MDPEQLYDGREQTRIKHLFLKNYLERLSHKILSQYNELVYIDGFSGPWQNKDEQYEDTSFSIAINKLRMARNSWKKSGNDRRIRCVFVEKDRTAFKKLQAAAETFNDVEVKLINGVFEENIQEIVEFVGSSFVFTFVDPTGLKVDLRKIAPLLKRHPGEVLFNFMYDFAVRFYDEGDMAETFEFLFGDPNWKSRLNQNLPRGERLVQHFRSVLRDVCNFRHVSYTPVPKPDAESPYFFLFHGTRHLEGLNVFRQEQRRVRRASEAIKRVRKVRKKEEISGQGDMFGGEPLLAPSTVDAEIQKQQSAAQVRMMELLKTDPSIPYESLLSRLLENFEITKADVNRLVEKEAKDGTLEIDGLQPGKRAPRKDHIIRLLTK